MPATKKEAAAAVTNSGFRPAFHRGRNLTRKTRTIRFAVASSGTPDLARSRFALRVTAWNHESYFGDGIIRNCATPTRDVASGSRNSMA